MLCFGWTCNRRQCSSQNGEQQDPQVLPERLHAGNAD